MRSTAARSTTGRRALVRASASLVGIVAILIGVPLLLWRLGTPLLPARVPSLHEAVAVFLRPDNGSLLMGTLLVIGVLVWAQLSVSILAELVAALRHRPGLRVELPGLRASRLLASVLVAGVLGAGAAGPALAAEPIAAVVRIDHQAGDPATAGAAVAGSSPTQRELPRYVVQERDSLWRIAEARLGDPLRWRESTTSTTRWCNPTAVDSPTPRCCIPAGHCGSRPMPPPPT